MPDDHATYHPVDTLASTASTTMQTALCGAMIAGVQNTLRKQNVGAMGIFTKSGGVIALYAGVGAVYQFSRDSAANLRGKDDAYNEAIGGFLGGIGVGLARRSIPFMLGMGVVTATTMSAWRYTSGMRGPNPTKAFDGDEVERKETLKMQRRQPYQETIDQLGEGRGIYGPGYAERRRERLLQKYGVDVSQA
ncbi:NADH-ubiquinone oxidoreductase 213 kDa subunit [Polyplosphaeria fusca]|uniref:NADH-ubiquinone oxidoreductase 213 kDa subunit n=1 Tax=Polyplosphaeria fusca TaxID=682080 RepID=A0A9P4R375_9PLEO|nr:NADH-ubiquinone oxidoreductase 213 kDa subunit [Polyplosphaeria fusca]